MVNNLTHSIVSNRLELAGVSNVERMDDLVSFLDLLVKWNRKINLTSLDIQPLTAHAVDKLIVEPVVASAFANASGLRVIDLGTGGGSPAIPFRLQLQPSSFRMVESRSKKCAFLREAVRTAGLSDTKVEESRFEELSGRPDLKSSSDLITVRAVRFDHELVGLFRYLLASGGRILRFTSSDDTLPVGGLELVSRHPLVASTSSELQVIRLVD